MINRKAVAAALFIVPAVTLSGCAGIPQAGPDYSKPHTPVPDQWTETSDRVSYSAPASEWWRVFDDPVLDALIADGLARNYDLKVLLANLRKARALRDKTAGRLQPNISGGAGAQALSRSENGLLPVNDLPGLDADTDFYDAGFDAVWEIDLFGGKRRAVEAAEARLQLSEVNIESAQLSLAAEIARAYVELVALERQRGARREIVAALEESRRLVSARLEAGAAKQSDLSRATTSLLRAQAQIPPIESEIKAVTYRLAILTGARPDQFEAERKLHAPARLVDIDTINLSAPAAALRARPDVRQAERLLAAETADIGVAEADLLPRLSLLASGGLESVEASDLFNTASFAGAVGPRITLPVFGRKSLKAQVEVERAEAEAALASYQQVILRALEETESAIARYDQAQNIVTRLQRARQSSAGELKLAESRFTGGEDDYSAVLESQTALLEVDLELSEATRLLRTHTISLMKSVGGAPAPADSSLDEDGV